MIQTMVEAMPSYALFILIAACILLLSKGADLMIEGAVSLARKTGMSRVAIGATIVSLGTTTPEAFVSVTAAWMGNPGLALGNGVGSIIADTGLIFGFMCMISSVPINRYILDRTGRIQVGAATLLVVISLVMLATGPAPVYFPRAAGLVFLVLLALYMWQTYRWSKNDADDLGEERSLHQKKGTIWLMTVGGLFMVVAGARILVPGASELASRFGVSDDIIAATLVAFGTSLPELVTAIASVRKGHPEIMVGNIVGADVLNCLFVIGSSSAVTSLEIPMTFFYLHFPAMLAILYLFRLFINLNKKGRFYRWQGGVIFLLYWIYVILQYILGTAPVH